jgi:putative Mg2+ transporter-C (MgtC) family protein
MSPVEDRRNTVMITDLTLEETLIRLGLAVLLAGALGLERELVGKPAGLRTHMMVALGAAAFTLITLQIYGAVAATALRSDPLRIVEGVIGGIGFLGAGTIIRSRGSVEGITTAASIWVVGGIGLACGAGFFREAAIVTAMALIIVSGVGLLAARLFHRQRKDREEESRSR